MRIWRRLQSLGAVALKNAVYVLPNGERAREDFEWLLREILEGGAEGSVCEVRFLDGISDEEIVALFNSARDADYREIAGEAEALLATLSEGEPPAESRRAEIQARVKHLSRRLAGLAALDFFGAPRRPLAESLLAQLDKRLRTGRAVDDISVTAAGLPRPDQVRGWAWVTRRGVHVDRIASAWLVRRFIDPAAEFKFVAGNRYEPGEKEVRFDMFEAEFTHVGSRCTFEVLIRWAGLKDRALRPIAQVVHDIDLKDGKYGREETAGIERLIAGITLAHDDDRARLERGSALFDDLYEYFRRKRAQLPRAEQHARGAKARNRRGNSDSAVLF